MAFLTEAANRGSISTGYNIDNSLKFEADNSEQLYRTPSSAGNQKTWTYSVWFKRTELGASQQLISAQDTYMYFETSDQAWLNFRSGSENFFLATNRLFRDCSAWYHAVIVCETANSTAADRAQLWINGVRETSYANSTYQNLHSGISTGMNSTNVHRIGQYSNYGSKFSGYMAEINLVDGQALDPTYFGEFDDNGVWIPKEYTGTYGTNGFYLDFADANNLGDDESGNGNDWTAGAISSVDQATDTPTNNFCTLNVLNATSNNGGGNNEYTEGATKGKALQTSEMASGTMAVAQGKWYYECKAVSNSDIMAGWGVPTLWGVHSSNPGYDSYSFAVHSVGRAYYYGNSYIDFSPSVSFDTNDIISVALDADNGFCYWAKNGTWMNGGSPTSGSTGTGGFNYIGGSTGANMEIVNGDFLIPALRTNYYTNSSILLNFGGYTTISISSAASDANGHGAFEYAPPSGYYALCTKNLAEYG